MRSSLSLFPLSSSAVSCLIPSASNSVKRLICPPTFLGSAINAKSTIVSIFPKTERPVSLYSSLIRLFSCRFSPQEKGTGPNGTKMQRLAISYSFLAVSPVLFHLRKERKRRLRTKKIVLFYEPSLLLSH